MADFYTHSFSDNIRLAKSKPLLAPADGTYNLIRIPHFALVKGVWVWITTPYIGGAPNVTVGFTGNKETADLDGFMDSVAVDPTVVGLKAAMGGNAVWADGKYFDQGSGAITLSTVKGTTAGTVIVFVDYAVVH